MQSLKLNLLSYIFKQRLVRDEQYNDLYEHLVERFPEKEEIIKTILFEIVSTLDSWEEVKDGDLYRFNQALTNNS